MKTNPVLAFVLLALALSCTPQQAKTAESIGVRVADDACHEVVDAGLAPDWVSLVCAGLDAVSGEKMNTSQVKVTMPRAEWHAIKARKPSADAGAAK